MDCICLRRKRPKKTKGRKQTTDIGLHNSAYVRDEDDDILANNAVLAEMEKNESETRLPSTSGLTSEGETRSGSSLTGETNSIKATANVLPHAAPRDKRIGTPISDSLNDIPTHTQDDLCLTDYNNYECIDVDLVSKDSIGPGFSVNGTLTDGIIIGSLTDKGPALESGKISVGDRIMSVTIGFHNMAYEDALTILSYAAPYPMTLQLARSSTPITHLSTSPTKELHEISTGVYHPVYRSQSVGGGTHSSKKQRKVPSRPGTSLSQMIAAQETIEGSQTSLEGSLVKDKFGNTLNLISATDSNLHVSTLSDSDTTVDSSLRSDSRVQSTTRLAETSEEVATAFNVPVQAVAGSVELHPVIAEAMVTEPPTQLKLAALGCSSPTSEGSETGSSSRVTTPTSPNQIPPEKPKRIHQLMAEVETIQSPSAEEPSRTKQIVVEEEILPASKTREVYAMPDWVVKDNSVEHTEVEDHRLHVLDTEGVDAEEQINEASSPVEEPVIEPSYKIKQLESINPDSLTNDDDINPTTHINTEVVKPATLTVDTVKIKDADELLLETATSPKSSITASEQPSPNDSGIHSENAASESDGDELEGLVTESHDDELTGLVTESHGDELTGLVTESPHLLPSIRQTRSSEDLMSVVLGLPVVNEKADNSEGSETQSTSSQATTPRKLSLTGLFGSSYSQQPIKRRRPRPRSAGAAPTTTKFVQPEPVIPKATSRSQLEAARARFFAELMQTSDLFKDTPTQSLSFSSDSLNMEPAAEPAADPFRKYVSKSVTTNNNSLSNSYIATINESPGTPLVNSAGAHESSA